MIYFHSFLFQESLDFRIDLLSPFLPRITTWTKQMTSLENVKDIALSCGLRIDRLEAAFKPQTYGNQNVLAFTLPPNIEEIEEDHELRYL